jgi:hypothetical protein
MNLKKVVDELTLNYGLKYHVYDKDGDFQLPFSVRLEIKFQGIDYFSWGVDKNQDLAFFKALMELFERITVLNFSSLYYKKNIWSFERAVNEIATYYNISSSLLHPMNTNGCGIHFSTSKAKKSALMELIERHTILSALLLNVSPQKTSFDLRDYKVPDGYRLEFYFWKVQERFVSLAVAHHPKGGFYFSHACAELLQLSLMKSFEEISPNLIFGTNEERNKAFDSKIVADDLMSFNHYWRFSGDKRILDLFSPPQNYDYQMEWDKIPKIKSVYYASILIPNKLPINHSSLKCFRAISPEAQQLFFDNWSNCYINENVFKHYTLPEYPHIIA